MDDKPRDMMTTFELSIDALRARRNSKWNRYGGDVIPAWVAEMDFSVAAPIQAAVQQTVDQMDYGYPLRNGNRADIAVNNAFAARMKERFDWEVDPDNVLALADLVQGTFAPIRVFSEPGDGVVLQVPAYPPFREAIIDNGRRLIEFPMVDDGTRYQLDIPALERLIDPTTRILVLCNPQNPTGRVFERDELLEFGRVAIERDLIIISDEIHSDLVFDGRKHIPIASLSPEIAARTVTITSPTKSFNIPGLRCAVVYFGSGAARPLLQELPAPHGRSAQHHRHRRDGGGVDAGPALARRGAGASRQGARPRRQPPAQGAAGNKFPYSGSDVHGLARLLQAGV